MPGSDQIVLAIKSKAKELGFLECAVLPVGFLSEEEEYLSEWLGKGMHGEMGYMARNFGKRLNPGLLFENAKTIIIALLNYFPGKTQTEADAPVLSKYAYGTDYHFVMKAKLARLLEFIREEASPCNGRVFTDSAPILERAWARRAGLGWIGKNSNLISPEYGSFFFIGEIIIDAELPYGQPKQIRDRCGTCTRCIDACPTKAIIANRVVDARKCISYQTIELKGDLDESLRGKFQNRVFGCDICQDVCPWNLKSSPHHEPEFEPAEGLLALSKNDWNNMLQTDFNKFFRNSAVKRTGFKGLKRNLDFINSCPNE